MRYAALLVSAVGLIPASGRAQVPLVGPGAEIRIAAPGRASAKPARRLWHCRKTPSSSGRVRTGLVVGAVSHAGGWQRVWVTAARRAAQPGIISLGIGIAF